MANTSLQPNAGYLQLLRDNPVITGLVGALAVAGATVVFGAGLSFTPGPARITSDNFDRTETPLSTGWSNGPGFVTGMRANGTSAVGGDAVFDTGSVYTGATFPPDQYSEVIVGSVATSPARGGPSVRNSSSVHQGYYLQINNTSTWAILKPGTGLLDSFASGTFYKIVAFNDTVRLEVTGGATTKLRVFLNGVEGQVTSGSLTDTASPPTTGNPGIWANQNDTKFLDWSGGSAGTDNPLSLTGYAPSLIQQTNLVQPSATTLTLVGAVPTFFTESGNVNKTVSNGSLTLNGASSGVAQSTLLTPGTGVLNFTRSGSITTSTGALALTGQQPAPFYGTITPSVGALALTGIVSSVLTNAQSILTPGTGAAFFGESTQVATVRGSFALTGGTPTRVTNIFRSVPVGNVVLVGGQAAIGPTVTTTLTPGGATLALTGQLSIQPLVITTPGGSLALTGQAPTVRQALSVTPSGTTLTLSGQPAGSFQNGIVTAIGTLTLSGGTPAVGRSVAPDTGSLDLVGTQAQRVGDQTFITLSPGTLTLTPQLAQVAGPVLTPPSGAVLATGIAPTFVATALAQISPSPGALLAAGLSGSRYESSVLSPGSDSMVVVGYGPDIGGVVVTADTGALLFLSDTGLTAIDSGPREVTPGVGILSIVGSLGSGGVTGHARVSFISPLRIRSFKAPSQP